MTPKETEDLLKILQRSGKSYKELMRDLEYYTEEVGLGIREAVRIVTKDYATELEEKASK